MTHRKACLPEKVCPVCLRPFAWRKKWQRCWDTVIYCSERCRRNRRPYQKVG
ncbi:MAG: DUF2256 domain-containing protein [Puniceicoccaceae bacterium]